jgi:hypothetical protein
METKDTAMTDRVSYRETLVTPETPLRCDRCGSPATVAEVEARPLVMCGGGCYMGPRWQTLDELPYHPKADQVYP